MISLNGTRTLDRQHLTRTPTEGMSEREEDNERREREIERDIHLCRETKEIDAYGKTQAEGKGENRDGYVCCGEKDVSSVDMWLQ